jgi:MFS family permease
MGYYYTWDQTAQAILRCSRYISYILIHVPAGYLADQFGGKQVLMVALLGMSFFCFIIPTVVQISIENCVFVVVVKILSGLFEGAIYPSVNAVLAQWTPDKDRTSTACYVYTGAPIGVIMAIVLTNSVAIVTRHWPSVFYFFGSVLVILCIAWKLFAYSAPEIHPCITNKERNYLEEELGGTRVLQFFSSLQIFCRGKCYFWSEASTMDGYHTVWSIVGINCHPHGA